MTICFRLTFAAAALTLLASCAVPIALPYKPQAGDDVAKIRVKIGNASGLSGSMRAVANGHCSTAVRVPRPYPYVAPPPPPPQATNPHITIAPPEEFPRAGMFGAVAAQRSDEVELSVRPGRQYFEFTADLGHWQCRPKLVLDTERAQQYELEMRYDVAGRKCFVQARRLDVGAPTPAWREVAAPSVEGCPA